MIISLNAYYVICGLIVFTALFPMLYGRIKKVGNKYDWTWIFALILIPINWFTPAIYEVKDCDHYTKRVLIIPKSDYSMGRHNYIINNSSNDLFFEFIAYGNVDHNEMGDDIIISPGTSYQAPVISINYVFEEAPTSIKMKSSGAIYTRLSCDVPQYEEYEEEDSQDTEVLSTEQQQE